MRSTTPLLVVAAVSMAGCGLAGTSTGGVQARAGEDAVFEGPVPRAACGPDSKPEPADVFQGQRATEEPGYWCNLELVGQESSPGGASWNLAWYEDCAYYNRDFPSNTTVIQSADPGVVVVDVSDPSTPKRTTSLTSIAMLDPHESLKMNERRALLGAVAGFDAVGNGPAFFDVYDVSSDCADPQLRASVPANLLGHEGGWAPDGLTYYATQVLGPGGFNAIDVTDPMLPRLHYTEAFNSIHGLSVSDDGKRAYLAKFGHTLSTIVYPDNGLTIVDVSSIQSRATVPSATVVGQTYWPDGASAQMTIPVTIRGKPYVIFADEGGYGSARIIDISDETNPVVIAKLKLEIHDPDIAATDTSGLRNDAHYCGVPQRNEPEIVACTFRQTSGMRVFDIRDPYHPKEIAYFNLPFSNPTSDVRIVKERGELWFTDQTRGFFVVRFTNGVWPFKE